MLVLEIASAFSTQGAALVGRYKRVYVLWDIFGDDHDAIIVNLGKMD